MKRTVDSLLHPRIVSSCVSRHADGYFKDAVREAMVQVERALKEKSGLTSRYGVNLITSAFGAGTGIKLRVPYGPDMQAEAEAFFTASFKFHRNYAAHLGDKINEITSLRILVLASELLDLIGASAISYADVGGVDGLVAKGVFPSRDMVSELLSFLDGYRLPDEVSDGFYEDLARREFTEKYVQRVVDLGLVEYTVDTDVHDPGGLTDTVGCFDLTLHGKSVLRELTA